MGAIIGFVLIVALVCAMIGIPVEAGIIIGIVGLIGMVAYYVIKDNNEAKRKKEEADKIKSTKEYQDSVNKYDKLMKKYKTCDYYFKDEERDIHYAIFDNKLRAISELIDDDFIDIVKYDMSDLKEHVYDIDKIRYYKLEGSVYQQQHISGGGGGGASIKGAVVGGLIAGDAGAIIGSRKKIDDIQTTYEEEDDRHVIVTFTDDDELRLPYQFYDRLLDYIPEKDYDNYIAAKKAKGRKK